MDTHEDYGGKYDSKRRFASYWHQIDEILSLKPKRVLEIGVGSGFVSRYIREKGIDLITLDYDPATKPDVVGDAIKLPFGEKSFDVVSICEVLEHMPYEKSLQALREVLRVSSAYAVISVPDATRAGRLEIPVPGWGKFQKLIVVPRLFPKVHAVTKSGHHWEIGKKDYLLKRFLQDTKKAGFRIVKTYRVYENPYHRFFVLTRV